MMDADSYRYAVAQDALETLCALDHWTAAQCDEADALADELDRLTHPIIWTAQVRVRAAMRRLVLSMLEACGL